MMWKPGVYTALITPFLDDGSLDLESFRTLVKDQIVANISGIVLWGSTGEGPLLTEAEKFQLLDVASIELKSVAKPPQLVLNVGGSATAAMVALCEKLSGYTYDAMMVVTPPYVKPPIEGIIAHVNSVKRFNKDVLFYNIPGRTGRHLTPEELLQLIQACPHLTALKEASGNLEMLSYIKHHAGDISQSFTCYIGDDPLYRDSLTRQLATGVVSVISNAVPTQWQNFTGQPTGPKDTQAFDELCRIFKLICSVPNPIGIKHTLYKLGLIKTHMCRLPLLPYEHCASAHLQVPSAQLDAAIDRLKRYR